MYDAAYLNYLMQYYTAWLGAPAGTLLALAPKESRYNPTTGEWRNVCNYVGACGLMQLRQIALADIRNNFGFNVDPMDPAQAIVGATAMMILNYRYMAARGVRNITWAAIVVAYNGGWTAGKYFAENGYAPTKEGQDYVAFWAQNVGLA